MALTGTLRAQPPSGLLDGLHFEGSFGPLGKPGDRDETLYFAAGRFWTKECGPCGFSASPYSSHAIGDAIHFQAELTTGAGARLRYVGVLRGQALTAAVKWRRDRWYWRIDRDFQFSGSRAAGLADQSGLSPTALPLKTSTSPRRAAGQPSTCRL